MAGERGERMVDHAYSGQPRQGRNLVSRKTGDGFVDRKDRHDRAMIVANSRLDVPRAKSDFTSRSSDTVGSPASILATRDWLDLMARARPSWVTPRACRRVFSPSASFSRRLT